MRWRLAPNYLIQVNDRHLELCTGTEDSWMKAGLYSQGYRVAKMLANFPTYYIVKPRGIEGCPRGQGDWRAMQVWTVTTEVESGKFIVGGLGKQMPDGRIRADSLMIKDERTGGWH